MTVCIFCQNDRKGSREHVLPLWFQSKFMPSGVAGITGIHASMLTGSPASVRTASLNSLSFSRVCENCNNGWMSRLETKFANSMDKLQLTATPKSLSKVERKSIALWMTKTCLMIHLSANYRKILPVSLAEEMRLGTSVPRNIRIFYGASPRDQKAQWIQGTLPMAILPPSANRLQQQLAYQTYQLTLMVGTSYLKLCWHGFEHGNWEIDCPGEHTLYPHPKASRAATTKDSIESIAANALIRLKA